MSIWVHYIVVRLDDHTFVLEKLVFLYFLPLLKTSRKRCRFCRCQFEWLKPFCAEFVITQDRETRAHLTKNIWSNPAFRNYHQFILVSRRTICSLAPADQKSKSRSWAQRVDYYSHLITCFNIGVTIHFVVTDICRGCYVLIPGTCPSSNERRQVFLVLTFLVSGSTFLVSIVVTIHLQRQIFVEGADPWHPPIIKWAQTGSSANWSSDQSSHLCFYHLLLLNFDSQSFHWSVITSITICYLFSVTWLSCKLDHCSTDHSSRLLNSINCY